MQLRVQLVAEYVSRICKLRRKLRRAAIGFADSPDSARLQCFLEEIRQPLVYIGQLRDCL